MKHGRLIPGTLTEEHIAPKLKPLLKIRTRSQLALFGTLLTFFNGQKLRALKRQKLFRDPNNYIHPIPLQSIYNSFGLRGERKNLVKFAANVFFKRVSRGNNLEAKQSCSGWVVRAQPRISVQLIRLLPLLFEENKELISEFSSHIMVKSDTKEVKFTTEKKWRFATDEQADMFKLLIEEALVEFRDDVSFVEELLYNSAETASHLDSGPLAEYLSNPDMMHSRIAVRLSIPKQKVADVIEKMASGVTANRLFGDDIQIFKDMLQDGGFYKLNRAIKHKWKEIRTKQQEEV